MYTYIVKTGVPTQLNISLCETLHTYMYPLFSWEPKHRKNPPFLGVQHRMKLFHLSAPNIPKTSPPWSPICWNALVMFIPDVPLLPVGWILAGWMVRCSTFLILLLFLLARASEPHYAIKCSLHCNMNK